MLSQLCWIFLIYLFGIIFLPDPEMHSRQHLLPLLYSRSFKNCCNNSIFWICGEVGYIDMLLWLINAEHPYNFNYFLFIFARIHIQFEGAVTINGEAHAIDVEHGNKWKIVTQSKRKIWFYWIPFAALDNLWTRMTFVALETPSIYPNLIRVQIDFKVTLKGTPRVFCWAAVDIPWLLGSTQSSDEIIRFYSLVDLVKGHS